MKIGFLAETQSIHTVRWINYLKNKGIEVFAITNQLNPDLDVKQYELKRGLPLFISSENSAFRYAISPLSIYNVKNILKKEKPDILHAHYISSYGFIAAMTGFKPLILTAWGSDILLNPNQYKALKWMIKKAIKKADLITCDAHHIKDKIEELGGENIKLILFGTDTEKFKPYSVKRGYFPTIISLRNLEPLYDVETLVRSVQKVLMEYPEAYFICCGDGSQFNYLKALANRLGVSEKIQFIGKELDVKRFLNISNIYVSTAKSDAGLAASTAEAMACELPVIVTDLPINRIWIKNGVNGYLFSISNHSQLSKHIINLIENKQLRKDMGKANRDIIINKLNYETEMDKMIELYQEIKK